jgi:hypothetical protein
MIPQWEKDIIETSKQYVYSIEWLNSQEEVLDEVILDVVSGNVNFDSQSDSRRSCSLTLNNFDKSYLPAPNSKMWINNKFRLKAGYLYGHNQTLMYNQGIYCLGNPSILSNPTKKEVTIQGLDKWAWLDGTLGGKIRDIKLIIPHGTRLDTAIKMIIEEHTSETKYMIDECAEEIPYDIEKPFGTTVSEVLKEIADIVSYQIFYDNDGILRFRKKIEPKDYNQTPISYSYTTEGLYLESTRELNWNDVRNSIGVFGDTMESGVVIYAISQDNSDSEFSISNIGLKHDIVEDTNIYSVELAQTRADWELQKRIMVAESNRGTIIPNFSHKLDDIINIEDENNGATQNYVLQNISYDISFNSTMNLGLWAVRDWR